MDADFLELIHTFQKAGKRMTSLNETILGFNEVVTGLQDDLDQLVEMVELEDIVEVAQKTSQTLNNVNLAYESMNDSYERFLNIKQLQEQYVSGFESVHKGIERIQTELDGKINDLAIQLAVSKSSLEQGQRNELAMIYEDYLYQKSGSNLVISTLEGEEVKVIEAMAVSQFFLVNEMLFIQNTIDQCLYVACDLNIQKVATHIGTPFVVKDYQIYHLVNQELMKTQLLLNVTESIAGCVDAFSIHGGWVFYEQEGVCHKIKG